MSKRCLFILFCLFICITQYAYADYTVSESQIDSVINWAGENRSGYTNKCGAYVFEAFQFKLGSPPFFSSNGKDCAYGRGFSHSGLTCDSSMLDWVETPLNYTPVTEIPRGAIVFYGCKDGYDCAGHIGIFNVYEKNGKKYYQICDAESTSTGCRDFFYDLPTSYCYDKNGNYYDKETYPDIAKTYYQGWSFWKGFDLYSETPGSYTKGAVDEVYGNDDGTLHLRGWACDPDDPSKDVTLHVYVGGDPDSGKTPYEINSNHKKRTDVSSSCGGNNDYYGFEFDLPVSERGTNQIYVYALDLFEPNYGSKNSVIGGRNNSLSATISETPGRGPKGALDDAYGKENGTVHIRGWACDPDSPDEDITLHVYIGGMAGSGVTPYEVTSNHKQRSDVSTECGNSNDYHGYELDIPVSERGTYPLYVYALDSYSNNHAHKNRLIGRLDPVTITKTVNEGILDVNGILDGIPLGDTGNFGTFRVYLNDYENCVAFDAIDYCESVEEGTEYIIDDIKANDGFSYEGSESYRGIITAGNKTEIPLEFKSCYLDIDGWLDGSPSVNLMNYGTFTITVNGQNYVNQNDFWKQVRKGSSYSITSIQPNPGYKFIKVREGSQSGNVGAGTTKIVLEFETLSEISHTVTFKVANGSWNDGTSADKTVTLTGYEGDTLKLASTDIPTTGTKPDTNYMAGSWDTTPDTETLITSDTTYTYTYAPKFYINSSGRLIGYYGTDENVIVPDGVTAIGESVFINNTTMKTIVLPDTVRTIGDRAFIACNNLTEITIPDSVIQIGYAAFHGCSSLKSLTLPANLKTISDWAFRGCSSLESLTLPEGLLTIGERAFQGCSSLTEISIPENVTSIGNYAFADCTNVNEIDLPNSLSSIGDGAFSGCRSLEEVTVPEKITSIGASTFLGCSDLTSVSLPSGVTSIGNYAFGNCQNLSEIVIPENVATIGDGAFSGCESIENLILPAGITVIKPALCNGCSGLSSIIIPEAVTQIENNAFYNCTNLEKVYLSDSVVSIDYYAFGACRSLTDVYYSGLRAKAKNISFGTENTYLKNAAWHYGQTVTFKVVNGAWNDGTSADKTVILSSFEDDMLKLASTDIPAVGAKPGSNYKVGSWDTTPSADTAITGDVTYTYTYAQKGTVSHTVTFKVVNGKWNDGTTANKTATLSGYEGATLKLAAGQIPGVGTKPDEDFKEGSWDVAPSAETAITADTTYTYAYAPEDDSVKLIVSSERARPGQNVTVVVSIENNPGISTMTVNIVYDETRLNLIGIEPSGFTDWIVNGSVANYFVGENSMYNGEILKVKFEVVSDAADGDAIVNANCNVIGDSEENRYSPQNQSGKVTVSQYIPGDINGDGEVDIFDLVRLRRHIVGINVEIVANPDVNNDKEVDIFDLVRLRRYIVGMNVEIY